MTPRTSSYLVVNGAIMILIGLAAGFPFAFEVLQRFELWPLPFVIPFDPPGDVRAWRMAHLEGILNGIFLFVVAGLASHVRLSPRGTAWVFWGLLVMGWGNVIASTLSPIFDARGLTFGGFWNSISYFLFVAGIFGAVAALIALIGGALARAKE